MADQTRKKARGKQPISRHPLFPAMVALWTGALFGVAALVLSPPLGAATRIMLALAVFAVGCVLGLMMALRFVHAAEEKAAGNDAADKVARKARIEREPEILDLANVDPETAFTEPAQSAAPDLDTPTQAPEPEPAEPEPKRGPAPLPTAAERIANAELSELSHVELLERLALSMQRRGRPSAVMPILQEEARAQTTASSRQEGVLEHGYRSLRSLAPSEAANRQPPAETEKALRDALAALQRMSGAA